MTGNSDDTVLTYLGWSGFVLKYPDAPPIVIDAQDETGIPRDQDIGLVVTHGHPEHIAGAAAWLRDKARSGAANVFASPGVCRFLARRGRPNDHVNSCLPGETHRVGDITIDVFRCRHMPLMPPEKGGTRERLRQIAGNPGLAASIVADVFRCPAPGPTLGFRFSHPAGPAVLFYGEGLHRGAGVEKITRVGSTLPAGILIAAVEPEDAGVMPDLVAATGAAVMVPYEAHAPWRRSFGMPCADLDALATRLERTGREVVQVFEGSSVRLGERAAA
jgi:L-ascorbate metabolism protein UlaG (beta-lactamase superfamily)